MEIYCDQCERTVGSIADERIPANRRGTATCPQCGNKIAIIGSDSTSPLLSSSTAATTDTIKPGRSTPLPESSEPVSGLPPSDIDDASEAQQYGLEFTGTAEEYFRIWIVNTFLTIITLGIYAAWAKVRTRQYFYANTKLAGHSFDYLANPVAILKGNLVIATGFILYSSFKVYNPMVSLGVAALFGLILPLLIYKSLRFHAHNSAFRNIRFRFSGSLADSYKAYLLVPLAIPLTFGFIVPYWMYRRKSYFFNNISFGDTSNTLEVNADSFYRIYVVAMLYLFGIFMVMGLAGGGLLLSTGVLPFVQGSMAANAADKTILVAWLVGLMVLIYVVMFMAGIGLQQFIYAKTTNYCWNQSTLGSIRFASTMKPKRLIWIQISNILAIIGSIGLLVPWAKVRRSRYILANLTVVTDQGLDRFAAAMTADENAVGEAATDFFDLEIGL